MNKVDHHPLIQEFPEFREKIHSLKISNKHFANLFESYEAADKTVVRIENGIELNSNEFFEEQKKLRLHLKDQLYALLNDINATKN
ncbi:MAG: DUF465 domain-containing protein [Arenimonas sp.]